MILNWNMRFLTITSFSRCGTFRGITKQCMHQKFLLAIPLMTDGDSNTQRNLYCWCQQMQGRRQFWKHENKHTLKWFCKHFANVVFFRKICSTLLSDPKDAQKVSDIECRHKFVCFWDDSKGHLKLFMKWKMTKLSCSQLLLPFISFVSYELKWVLTLP